MIDKPTDKEEVNDSLSEDKEKPFKKEFNNFDKSLNLSEKEVIGALKNVYDPEIPVNIYDLGLIYKIGVDQSFNVKIDMTLTSPNCPVAEEMPSMVASSIEELKGFNSVVITLIWDPPWDQDMMSEDAKLALDIP